MTKKDVGLRIRVDRQLRDAFVASCQDEDRPAAQVIREFMRDYVAQTQDRHGEKENHAQRRDKGADIS